MKQTNYIETKQVLTLKIKEKQKNNTILMLICFPLKNIMM
jgi:hypothetical protein